MVDHDNCGFFEGHTKVKKIIQTLEKENIEARPLWKPMHMQPVYKNQIYIKNNNEDIAKDLFGRGVCLPSGDALTGRTR